ncbi:hypothetical protein GGR28_003187 [Lewinella aquimaris]|uniref:Effector-associated domain-containing protein n=1 Tax=Neolewinella aquimaris TaxID=1835722 RepID=A0A840E9D5_9BACT|nr:SIR2 family protein [Neolewinella aquimaris]MBB4080553.1 hypothetical protein [Neolewinella aquimaris]
MEPSTISDPQMESQLLSDLQWNSLLRTIEQERCVICVGPEFYTTPGDSRSQSARLSSYLREHSAKIGIKVRENGWYHLRDNGDHLVVHEAVNIFYDSERQAARERLSKLASIPGHLFLCLTPDRHLAAAFKEKGYACEIGEYVRNEPDRNISVPDKHRPLVYNLVGDLEQRNSLVLTYNDFFNYMESTFRGNSMSILLKDNILSAECFIFLGMPPDDWRMHMFMHILKQHENRKSKYATIPNANDDIRESWQCQYGIRLMNEDIDGFLNGLITRCGAKNLLREKAAVQTSHASVSQGLRAMIGNSKTSDALNRLQHEIKRTGTAGRDLMLQVIQLKSRHTGLQEQITLGIIPDNDSKLELNKINVSLLKLIDDLEALQPHAMSL